MAVSTAPTVNQQKDLASFRAGKESLSDSVMWHTLPLEEAFAQLQADGMHGLTQAEAARRLAQ